MTKSCIPLVLVLSCFSGSCRHAENRPPLELRVVGSDYQWHITYPGSDGVLGTADDKQALRHVHVPSQTRVEMSLTSEDLIYAFRVKALKLNQMAVPDIVFPLSFQTGDPASYALMGDQMCGYSHDSLIGDFIVEPPSVFQAWLAEQPNAQP